MFAPLPTREMLEDDLHTPECSLFRLLDDVETLRRTGEMVQCDCPHPYRLFIEAKVREALCLT